MCVCGKKREESIALFAQESCSAQALDAKQYVRKEGEKKRKKKWEQVIESNAKSFDSHSGRASSCSGDSFQC